MSRQSSEIYGIKVKKTNDFYEFEDIIVKYNPNSEKQWFVYSNYDGLWMNGVNYPKESLILNFKDGLSSSFTIMAQYPDPETGYMTIYMYKVIPGAINSYEEDEDYSSEVEDPEPVETTVKYHITNYPNTPISNGKLLVRKYINDVQTGSKEVDTEDIRLYHVGHNSRPYRVFRNLIFNAFGQRPTTETIDFDFYDIHLTFNPDENKWIVFSLYDNVYYNGQQYIEGKKILDFPNRTAQNFSILGQHPTSSSSIYNNYMHTVTVDTTYYNLLCVRTLDGSERDRYSIEEPYSPYTFTIKAGIDYLEYNGVQYGNSSPDIYTWPYRDIPIDIEIEDISGYGIENNEPKSLIRVYSKKGSYSMTFEETLKDVVAASKKVTMYELTSSGKSMEIFGYLTLKYENTGGTEYFAIYSASNYLKYNNNGKQINELIYRWSIPAQTDIDFNIYIVRDPNIGSKAKASELVLVKYRGQHVESKVSLKSGQVYYDILYSHKEMYYNGHYHKAAFLVYDVPEHYVTLGGVGVMWADPYWFLLTTTDGLRYGGYTWKERKLVRTWDKDTVVNMTFTKNQTRSKSIRTGSRQNSYKKVNYYVTTSELNDTITLEQEVNEEVTDTVVFDPNTDLPLNFYNIQFRKSGNNITIYSKCDYIHYNGNTYPLGRSIVTWPINEKVALGIDDETDKYMVTETCTWNVKTVLVSHITYGIKTENVDQVTYKIKSAENGEDEHGFPIIDNHIKMYKQVNTDWVYDYNLNPTNLIFIQFGKKVGNIKLVSNADNTAVKLISLSDWIKYEGQYYKKNDLITEWNIEDKVYLLIYDETSLHEVAAKKLVVRKNDNNNNTEEETVNFYDAMYEPKIIGNLAFEFDNKPMSWTLRAMSNTIVYEGTSYDEGDVIATWNYNEVAAFSGIEDNVDHHKEILMTRTTRDLTTGEMDEDSIFVTEDSGSFSKYGYIWKKLGPGPTPPTPDYYLFDCIPIDVTGNNGYRYFVLINSNGFGRAKKILSSANSNYRRINVDDGWWYASGGETVFTILDPVDVTSSSPLTFTTHKSNFETFYYTQSALMKNFYGGHTPGIDYNGTRYRLFQVFKIDEINTLQVDVWNENVNQRESENTSQFVDYNGFYPYIYTKYLKVSNNTYLAVDYIGNFVRFEIGEPETRVAAVTIDVISRLVSDPIYTYYINPASVLEDAMAEYPGYSQNLFRRATLDPVLFEDAHCVIQGYGYYIYETDYFYYKIAVYDYIEKRLVRYFSLTSYSSKDFAWTKVNSSLVYSGNKLYAYVPRINTGQVDLAPIDIYEMTSTSIDSILSPRLVRSVEPGDTINVHRFDTISTETYTIKEIIDEFVNIDGIAYNDLNKTVNRYKTAMYRSRYIREGNNITDNLILYIEDPSFASTGHCLGFAASALRYASIIGEW